MLTLIKDPMDGSLYKFAHSTIADAANHLIYLEEVYPSWNPSIEVESSKGWVILSGMEAWDWLVTSKRRENMAVVK